ncbi:hypothetical protein [Marinoscillum sp.]|uniref:hypothetical protein n=1 Tax=Marinoscillum sp. TaxID=2024838 RepID=UPI003BABEDE9
MKSGMIRGLLFIAVGLFLIYWAQTHTRKNLGNLIDGMSSESYTMSEPWYYACLGLGILVGVVGVLRTYKSMK